MGMKITQYLIFMFSFFFCLYSVSTFWKTRKREFGILMAHGMSPRHTAVKLSDYNQMAATLGYESETQLADKEVILVPGSVSERAEMAKLGYVQHLHRKLA